jgi:ribosomal protein S18 acetylase RimI-like enzyme
LTLSIRPYQASDFDALYGLWGATLGASWPLTPEFLERMLTGYERYQEGDYLVAKEDGEVVGFVATQIGSSGREAGIHLLMVKPEKQRQEIGTTLHNAAMQHLRQPGIELVNLAHGGGEPLWPGVPLDPPGAVDFFKTCGWQFPDLNYDLTRDLADYVTPPGVLERAARQKIEVRLCATPAEADAVVDFERRVFPFWAIHFEDTANGGRYSDILAAWDGSRVVGSLLIEKADVKGLSAGALWYLLLGEDMGSIGAVGVDEAYQGQGIGLAMVAKASEILQRRGVRQCLIGWTDLIDFYGKLGYTVWRTYAMTDPP